MSEIARNSKSLIYGTCNAALGSLDEDVLITYLAAVAQSIKEKNHICPKNIKERFAKLYKSLERNLVKIAILDDESAPLVWISPLAFYGIYGYSSEDLDTLVKEIINISTDNFVTVNVAVEYVHLLHDILWGKISKNQIIEILPELDILEDELPAIRDARDTFFSALWCFTMNDNYLDTLKAAINLKSSTVYIRAIAGCLAGLYYGIDSISNELIESMNTLYDIDQCIF